ncbi:MAG: hypothetical protein J0652_01215 [Desulfobulbaceae bacterium]|nr:hypothetical protein [Desulfobulbaceae bacterium]
MLFVIAMAEEPCASANVPSLQLLAVLKTDCPPGQGLTAIFLVTLG